MLNLNLNIDNLVYLTMLFNKEFVPFLNQQNNMNDDKLQMLADKLTDIVMAYTFGQKYIECDDITENDEMSREWEYLNENFFELLASELS